MSTDPKPCYQRANGTPCHGLTHALEIEPGQFAVVCQVCGSHSSVATSREQAVIDHNWMADSFEKIGEEIARKAREAEEKARVFDRFNEKLTSSIFPNYSLRWDPELGYRLYYTYDDPAEPLTDFLDAEAMLAKIQELEEKGE